MLLFTLAEQRYALPVDVVVRVHRIAFASPLPEAPDVVSGLLNIAGEIVPLIDLRRRFSLPDRPIELSDRLVVVRTPTRVVALRVDDVIGTVAVATGAVVPAERILPSLAHVRGVVAFEDGLVLIQDLDAVLSLDEEARLDALLERDGVVIA